MKIWGIRSSLIGDSVMSLPILEVLEKKYTNSYKYFSIASKCKQSEELFVSHPLINEIKITEFSEQLGPSDFDIIKQCEIVIDVSPPHPKEQDWYNYRNCVEETALMAGIDPINVKGIKPKLYLNKNIDLFNKTIAIWPFAGYGGTQTQGFARSPTVGWWEKVCLELCKNGFNIIHCGVDSEPQLSKHVNYKKITHKTFVEQIYCSLGCSGVIGTDSGSMWAIGAYHKIPQINLLTNWLPCHYQNLLALAPEGDKVYNLFAYNGCDNIDIESLKNLVYKIFT